MSRILLIAALGSGLFIGCGDTFKVTCEDNNTCDGPAEGSGGAGETGGSEGVGDGDMGGDVGEGGAGTGGTPVDPCDACEGDTPLCNDDDECVACLGATDCDDPSTPMCNDGSCEAGCSNDDDCSEHADTVCDTESGACVECLTEAECSGGTKVCDRNTNTCTDLDAGAEFACEACEYNEQCAPGHVCVEMTYDDPETAVVGRFCLWERDAELPGPDGTCGINSRPYAQEATVTTVSGDNATVCQPRATCPAILQHAQEITGCETAFTDDNACGAGGFNDGRCRLNGSMEARCSYPCIESADCKAASTCPGVGDQFCSL